MGKGEREKGRKGDREEGREEAEGWRKKSERLTSSRPSVTSSPPKSSQSSPGEGTWLLLPVGSVMTDDSPG